MDEVNMEHRMTRVEKLAEGNQRRIEELEEDNKVLRDLATSVQVMAEQLKQLNGRFERLDSSVQALRDKPGKTWDTVLKTALTAGDYVSFSFINPIKGWTIIGDTTNNTIPYATGDAVAITRVSTKRIIL